jgi:hypothetical protein
VGFDAPGASLWLCHGLVQTLCFNLDTVTEPFTVLERDGTNLGAHDWKDTMFAIIIRQYALPETDRTAFD